MGEVTVAALISGGRKIFPPDLRHAIPRIPAPLICRNLRLEKTASVCITFLLTKQMRAHPMDRNAS
jgi:hypothetical protein